MMNAMTKVLSGGKVGSCQKSYSREQFWPAHWLKKPLVKVSGFPSCKTSWAFFPLCYLWLRASFNFIVLIYKLCGKG